ncbi:MAG TPA: type VI secretion system baseplate subunit TssF [Burkholderiaceae bacterium]|nr:type VI secretion system baseplate subunit TssF [Burkholderiaceae bacterium]
MRQLMPHFEAELALLRRHMRGFAERYPAIAGNLQLAGDTCKDPHVERLIQASALLAARVAKRLDDDYPLFTASLLDMLYPHYLRSFPSCSIARLDFRQDGAGLPDAVSTIPRGTQLRAVAVQNVKCLFTTASDIVLAPCKLPGARFHGTLAAPPEVRLEPDVSSAIAITIDSARGAGLDALGLPRLRLFIDGDPLFCAALRDTLFMRAASAYLALPGEPRWHKLARPPVAPAGFAPDEALIPLGPRSHPAYGLLTEYFAFPDKFNFIDLDWAAIASGLPPGCRSVTLYLTLRNAHLGGQLARTLGQLSAANLLLHCAPVVNLFRRRAVPVSVAHTAPDYALLADAAMPHGYEIHDVLSACLIGDPARRDGVEQLQPFYGRRHGQAPQPARYWVLRRDDITAELSPGHETRIALVDQELALADGKPQTLSAELLCSNRDLPTALQYGQPGGDLTLDGTLSGTPVRLLRKPSPSYRFESGNSAHWRLISHLSLNHRALSSAGLDEFRTLLTLYDLPRSPVTQRQIAGVTGLDYRNVLTWVRCKPRAALMPGVEIRLTLDEDAFVGGGLYLFVQVLDHFFALYGQINVYSQLLVLSKRTGEILWKCPPRSGERPLE